MLPGILDTGYRRAYEFADKRCRPFVHTAQHDAETLRDIAEILRRDDSGGENSMNARHAFAMDLDLIADRIDGVA